MGFYRGPRIVKNGLVLYLDAANTKSYPTTGTTWLDVSGNGNNGTLTNGPTFNTTNKGSLVFDGVNDRLTLTNAQTISSTSDWTIQTWVKSFQTGSSSAYLRFLGTSGSISNFFFFEWNNRIFSINSSANSFAFQTGFSPALPLDNSMFLLTLIGVNGNLNLYYNNILTNVNTPLTGSLNFTDIMNERRISNPGGEISLFCMYNRALSSTEVLQNYNATKGRFNL